MKKTRILFALILLFTSWALAGCGEKQAGSDEALKEGATNLLQTVTQLREALTVGDESKIKELGPKLEEIWSTFEDGVRPRNADLYEQIEQSLNPEVAGSQKNPVDNQVLTQLNDGLAQALNELLQTIK